MEKRKFKPKYRPAPITLFFLLAAFESILSGILLATIPSDSKNGLWLGFTLERWLMLSFFVLLTFFFLGTYLVLRKKQRFFNRFIRFSENHLKWLLWIFVILFWIMFFLFFMPAYRFSHFQAYYQRLRPFFLFGFLAGLTGLITLFFQFPAKFPPFLKVFKFSKPISKPFLVFFGCFIILFLFIRLSGWGITPGKEAWYANAVPLESLQVVLILAFYILLLFMINKYNNIIRFFSNRVVLFFLLWGIAALIWSLAPMERHFFAPGPYPPNNEFYPYSDAVFNDLSAQSALDGYGFNFHSLVFKPVVTFIIFICHVITGNQMNESIMLQSAMYAILPAILFLFASALAGIPCGILASVFMMLQEWNALNTTHILTIHSRLQMSEFTSQIILAALCFFVFQWFQKGKYRYRYAAAAGGMAAFGIYTRYNMLGVVFAIVFLAVIFFWKSKRQIFRSLIVFVIALVISASPWLYRSYQMTGLFLPEITGSFRAVVIDQRLKPLLEESGNVKDQEQKQAIISETQPQPTLVPQEETSKPEMSTVSEEKETERGKTLSLQIHPLIDTLGNHFFHNLSAIFFIPPIQIQFDNLEHLYTNKDSVWADGWNGSHTWQQVVFIFLNFLLLSYGFSFLWKRFSFSGISFTLLVLSYAASLGLARTSGGRYLVPMNWSMILLYAISLNAVIQTCIDKLSQTKNSIPLQKKLPPSADPWNRHEFFPIIKVIFIFFLFFFSMVQVEKWIPESLTPLSSNQIIDTFQKETDITADWENVRNQITEKKMFALQGKALYPRFYYFKTGEHGTDKAFQYKDYSRLIFKLIGKNQILDLVMPINTIPDVFPQNSDVLALVCKESHYIDVLALTGKTSDGKMFTYIRNPLRELSCPVSEPVCTGIENCY